MSDAVTRAREYLAGILDNPQAKPADKLRAAEAILREGVTMPTGRGVARGLDDAALEAIARSEGGTPPEKGTRDGTPENGSHTQGCKPPGDLALPPTPAAIKNRGRRGPVAGTPAGVTPAGGLARAARSGEDVDPLS